MPYTPTVLAVFLVGFLVSSIAAVFWRKYPWLHAVPFICACAGEVVFAAMDDAPWYWVSALLFVAVYYTVGWLTFWAFGVQGNKRHGA
jgi:hypothetical protein